MMFVEADAVIAEPVHFLPGIEMFGIGANRDVGLEVAVRQRIGQFAADLEMVELFAIGEQIEDEDLHGHVPSDNMAILPCGGNCRSGYGRRCSCAKRRGKILYMWN